MKRLMQALFALLTCWLVPPAHAALKPDLKVLLCTGDYGMYAQDRVPLIEKAVDAAAPGSNVSWESYQSYNFTRVLESPGFAERFDAIVMGDVGIGQLTPRAQQNLVDFVRGGGGLVWVIWAKSTIPFKGSEEAVPMPLKAIVPFAYPLFDQAADGSHTLASTDAFFAGIDFSPLKDPSAVKQLPNLLRERSVGKGQSMALYGAFGPSWKFLRYATFEKEPGGWGDLPQFGELWTRVLERVSEGSPVRNKSRAQLDAAVKSKPLMVGVEVDATRTVDTIRAADFSIVALQQLYNEDGGAGEDLFLALNPRDWFDRRTQEVLSNTQGVKADKPAFFREYNIKGIYMADDSYGSYGQWDEKKYQEQTDRAIAQQKEYPGILSYFQAGNEPPLDANYVAFHKRFVGDVLKGAPGYQVVGPNKAFNLYGVDPKEMQFYIDQCGSTTDVLNWHTYGQPPSTVLAEARYWSQRADGKLRSPGPAKVMFTESDVWNSEDSQFNYLMDRAFTFLPEPRILANFQYCMRPRSEGGTYRFGVLQPDGEMSANYNGYWIWRDLRGSGVSARLTTLAAASGHVHALASNTDNGQKVTVVLYYDTGYFNDAESAPSSQFSLKITLPPGRYCLQRSLADWQKRDVANLPGMAEGTATAEVTLLPCRAAAFTWTRQ